MRLIDTHTHLAGKEYSDILEQVLTRAGQAGVDRWVAVGTNLEDSATGIELSRRYSGMYCSVGVHPHEAGKQSKAWLEELRYLAQDQKVSAIGEIGLDYYYEFSDRDSQKQVFTEQLALAGETALPAVVHCRDAIEDCLGILDEWGRDDVPIVFHCFSGGTSEAKLLIERGYFVSFTGVITFGNARETQKAAQYVPLEMTMLETDCPYLSPEPQRNIRPNEPALLIHTAEKLAQLRGENVEKIAEVTGQNSRLFFGID